jgi:hypothetical protein
MYKYHVIKEYRGVKVNINVREDQDISSPLLAHIRQSPVQRDAIAGHQVEPIDVEQLLHLEQLMGRDHYWLPILAFIGSWVKHVCIQKL